MSAGEESLFFFFFFPSLGVLVTCVNEGEMERRKGWRKEGKSTEGSSY